MRNSKHAPDLNPTEFSWRSIASLLPYLMEHKLRVVLALICLVLAKIAIVGLPFVLKEIVDSLDQVNDGVVAIVAVPVSLVLAYGLLRFLNVILGEIRDTLFGRVTERAMRRVGLKLFNHLHNLDLDFHLNRHLPY